MAGLLVHAAVGALFGLIAFFIFKRKDYPISVFTGNLLPDLVGAGYASLMSMSLNPYVVLTSSAWLSINKDYVTQSFWIFLEAIFIVGFLFFHVYRRRSKIEKKFDREFEGNLSMLLLGFITHMMMDMLILEHGIWY